jgi:metal-responsive CopG/Arc/MetJ family transcriptional regulator
MSTITLTLPEKLLKASSKLAESLRLSRAAYIRRSIERMNRETERKLRAERMMRASLTVRSESMKVNAEFSAVEKDPNA